MAGALVALSYIAGNCHGTEQQRKANEEYLWALEDEAVDRIGVPMWEEIRSSAQEGIRRRMEREAIQASESDNR